MVEFLDLTEILGFKAIATLKKTLKMIDGGNLAQLIVYSRHGIAWSGTEDINRAISGRP